MHQVKKNQLPFVQLRQNSVTKKWLRYLTQICYSQHKAYWIQYVRFARAIEPGDGCEFTIEIIDFRSFSIRFETIENHRFDIHFDFRPIVMNSISFSCNKNELLCWRPFDRPFAVNYLNQMFSVFQCCHSVVCHSQCLPCIVHIQNSKFRHNLRFLYFYNQNTMHCQWTRPFQFN